MITMKCQIQPHTQFPDLKYRGGDFCLSPISLVSFTHEKVGMFWKISDQCTLNQVVTPVATVMEDVVSTETKSTEL